MKWVLNIQDYQMFGVKLNKYQLFSATWSSGSQWRDTTSSRWIFKLIWFSDLRANIKSSVELENVAYVFVNVIVFCAYVGLCQVKTWNAELICVILYTLFLSQS